MALKFYRVAGKPPLFGKRQQLLIRHTTPEEKREPRRNLQVTETVDSLTRGYLAWVPLDPQQEVRIDQQALKGMKDKDIEQLAALPKYRLNSGSSEILNWITAAGACEHLNMDVVEYVPVYRSPAGTGGGWGFAIWK